MSRLEQMREHFLQRIYSEQQLSMSKLSLSTAKSIQNIPCLLKPVSSSSSSSQIRRSRAQIKSSVKPNTAPAPRTNITRVKSLCNVSLYVPNPTTTVIPPKVPAASVNGKSNTKRSVAPSVNNSANSEHEGYTRKRVNRPIKSITSSRASESGENKRNAANKNELQCKHCQRKFSTRDRLEKHMDICQKTFKKQRPKFNSVKQRLKEMDAPKDADLNQESTEDNSQQTGAGSESNENRSKKISNWKTEHQQFIKAIKEARLHKANNPTGNDEVAYDEVNIDLDSDDDSRANCSFCKRKFHKNVMLKHEAICGKLFRKKISESE